MLPVLFSLDSGYNSFHVSSPDVTCSLSFSAKNATFSDQLLLKELPSSELSKLDGPAIIDGDTLQVTVHNGTSWELQEVVIGLTIVRNHDSGAAVSYPANAEVAAAAEAISGTLMAHFQKQADTTILLRIKGSAAPSTTAIFRTSLNFALFPDQEWHWAIVKAKGIPPKLHPSVQPRLRPAQSLCPKSTHLYLFSRSPAILSASRQRSPQTRMQMCSRSKLKVHIMILRLCASNPGIAPC